MGVFDKYFKKEEEEKESIFDKYLTKTTPQVGLGIKEPEISPLIEGLPMSTPSDKPMEDFSTPMGKIQYYKSKIDWLEGIAKEKGGFDWEGSYDAYRYAIEQYNKAVKQYNVNLPLIEGLPKSLPSDKPKPKTLLEAIGVKKPTTPEELKMGIDVAMGTWEEQKKANPELQETEDFAYELFKIPDKNERIAIIQEALTGTPKEEVLKDMQSNLEKYKSINPPKDWKKAFKEEGILKTAFIGPSEKYGQAESVLRGLEDIIIKKESPGADLLSSIGWKGMVLLMGSQVVAGLIDITPEIWRKLSVKIVDKKISFQEGLEAIRKIGEPAAYGEGTPYQRQIFDEAVKRADIQNISIVETLKKGITLTDIQPRFAFGAKLYGGLPADEIVKTLVETGKISAEAVKELAISSPEKVMQIMDTLSKTSPVIFSKLKPDLEKLIPQKTFTGKAYRAETDIPEHGAEIIGKMKTAQEKLDYDYGTTGNPVFKEVGKLAEEIGIDLKKVPVKELIWVAKDLETAQKYGDAKEVTIPKDTIVLMEDDEGGSLILKDSEKYREPVTVSLEEEGKVEALWAGEEIGKPTTEKPAVVEAPAPTKPPIPPSPPTKAEMTGEPIGDPIAKLNELIKQAKPRRGRLETEYTKERARRIAEVERAIDEIGGEQGYIIALSKLKGKLAPSSKYAFEPIKDKLSKEEIDSLYNKTFKHPYLDEWEKISAANELTNILAGEIPTPKGLVLLEEIYGTDLIKNILSKRALGLKIADVLIDVANIPRAILATADMSGFLRQGIVYVVSHPVIAAKAMGKTFQFAFNSKSFEQYFKDLPKDKLYPLMRKSGLAVTDPSRVLATGREEAFISRLMQQIPIIGQIIKFAERSYVGFLNKLRVDVFKTFADEFLSKGYSPVKDRELFKATAEVVNTFTGRGSMGNLNKITPFLNTIFFSPRLITARFNALNPTWYIKQPKEMRVKAISDFAKFVATGVTLLAIIKASGLGDVETDPRSSDFGKIRIGNTRWDIWGGFQQWARVFSQFVAGQRKNTATGEIISLTKEDYPFTTRKEIVLRFIEGKLAPVPALINELISGAKTFEGEDITFETVAREKFIPMYIQDIAEAYMDGGMGRAVGAGTTAFFGVGVQTWQERKAKEEIFSIFDKYKQTTKTTTSSVFNKYK